MVLDFHIYKIRGLFKNVTIFQKYLDSNNNDPVSFSARRPYSNHLLVKRSLEGNAAFSKATFDLCARFG